MIELPDFERAFDHENAFYLSCDKTRLAKVLAQYEHFKATLHLPGTLVECGVFKGASLLRFAMLRTLLSNDRARRIIAFDTFADFPAAGFQPDQERRAQFVRDSGSQSISVDQLYGVLRRKGVEQNVELIAGDVRTTIPAYVAAHPELRIALLNLDTDLHEPAVTIMEHLFPRVVEGGIVLIDDYGVFPGETRAVEDYLAGTGMVVKKLTFAMSPAYVVKRSRPR